jgi:hypothetical protein
MAGDLNRSRKVAILAIALVLVTLTAWGGSRTILGLRLVEQASTTVRSLELSLETFEIGSIQDISSLQGRVALVEDQLGKARSQLTPFLQLSSLLGWVPVVGPRLHSAEDMLNLADSLAHASHDLLTAVEIASSGSAQDNVHLLEGTRFNEDVLRTMAGGEPFFRSSLGRLDKARASLELLEDRDLPSDYYNMMTTAQRLTSDMETFALTGLAVSQLWQTFLGYDTPQTYLLVAQNSDELRATGGFIPGAWLLTLDQGDIAQLQFWDTVDVDDLTAALPLPPEGLLQSLWAGAWLFRDSGWYPDFPTSAAVMEQIFKVGPGISVDGVITLDQWAVRNMLNAIGPAILDTGEILDAASYVQILEEKTDTQGRQFMDTALDALLGRLREQSPNDLMVSILSTLNKSLQEKHILLSMHNQALQEVASLNGWDGALKDQPGDYLMVVDSNVGFSKVNRNISQDIDYQVDLSSEGESQARLDILYTNLSKETFQPCEVQTGTTFGQTYYELKNMCYWDYLRVYAPDGSTLQTSSPFPMPEGALYRSIGYNDVEDTLRAYSESAKAVFAGFFNLEAGESRGVAFAYNLPERVVQRKDGRLTYDLFIQKQPGTLSTPVEVTVRFPEGYCAYRASPSPSSWETDHVQFAVNLDSDTSIQLALERKSVCTVPAGASPTQAGALPSGKTLTAFASLSIEPARENVAVDHIQVSPQDATLIPGERFLFTAIAIDSQGKPVRDIHFRWRVRNSYAGDITSSGLFTAGASPGTYLDTVEVSVVSTWGTTITNASVTIIRRDQAEARLLSSVIVYPSDITVRPGQVVGLGALGWDASGRFVQNLRLNWSIVEPGAGNVDQFGFFSASDGPGPYPNAIRVTAIQQTPQGSIEREAFVSVTVSETARRGVLNRVVVIPRAVTLIPGQRVNFITRAFDESGQRVSNISLDWEVTQTGAGHIERPSQFVAGSQLGSYPQALRVVATQLAPDLALGGTLPSVGSTLPFAQGPVQAETTITVTVVPPRPIGNLSSVRLTPGVVTLNPGQRFVFSISGLDSSGHVVQATVLREVVDPTAGSINNAGVFTTGQEPGIYSDAIRVQLTQENGDKRIVVEVFATVNILGPLETLEISPSTADLEPGQSIRLHANGYDANGLRIPTLHLRWSVENPQAGTITESGAFTAGANPGMYSDTVKLIAVDVSTR